MEAFLQKVTFRKTALFRGRKISRFDMLRNFVENSNSLCDVALSI